MQAKSLFRRLEQSPADRPDESLQRGRPAESRLFYRSRQAFPKGIRVYADDEHVYLLAGLLFSVFLWAFRIHQPGKSHCGTEEQKCRYVQSSVRFFSGVPYAAGQSGWRGFVFFLVRGSGFGRHPAVMCVCCRMNGYSPWLAAAGRICVVSASAGM